MRKSRFRTSNIVAAKPMNANFLRRIGEIPMPTVKHRLQDVVAAAVACKVRMRKELISNKNDIAALGKIPRAIFFLYPKEKEKKMENETRQNVGYADKKTVDEASDKTECKADVSGEACPATDMAETPKHEKPKFFSAGNLAVMGILSAIAYILYLIPHFIPIFKLPFFPSFLDLQISDLPALLGSFAIGPWAGVLIIVVKCLLKMPFTSTACVGELADILVGTAFVLPAGLLYKHCKNRKGAILGMLLGTVWAAGISLLANWLVLIPFYVNAYGMDNVLKMLTALYPEITADTLYSYYLPLAVLPFNVLRCVICGAITYFVYKPLSKALHWEIKRKPRQNQ